MFARQSGQARLATRTVRAVLALPRVQRHGLNTHEQTLMSLGYPTADDVANLNSKTWLYWITDHVQYRVNFDGNDLVADVENVPDARSQILIE